MIPQLCMSSSTQKKLVSLLQQLTVEQRKVLGFCNPPAIIYQTQKAVKLAIKKLQDTKPYPKWAYGLKYDLLLLREYKSQVMFKGYDLGSAKYDTYFSDIMKILDVKLSDVDYQKIYRSKFIDF